MAATMLKVRDLNVRFLRSLKNKIAVKEKSGTSISSIRAGKYMFKQRDKSNPLKNENHIHSFFISDK